MKIAAFRYEDCKDDLCQFLRRFLPVGSGDSADAPEAGNVSGQVEEANGDGEAGHMQGACVYCGAPMASMSADIGDFQGNICPLCKGQLVREKERFYQLADETVRNAKYMCSIPWKRSIRIQKHSELQLPEPKKGGSKKKTASVRTVSLESRFVQAEIDDGRGVCTFKVRTNIPAGIVAASAIYTAAWAYLYPADGEEKADLERIKGLSYWYMVYYLDCMDYARYGARYDQAAERLISESGAAFYRELRTDRHGKYRQVFSIRQDIPLIWQREERTAAQTNPRQKEDKTGADSVNAGSDSTPD